MALVTAAVEEGDGAAVRMFWVAVLCSRRDIRFSFFAWCLENIFSASLNSEEPPLASLLGLARLGSVLSCALSALCTTPIRSRNLSPRVLSKAASLSYLSAFS